MARGGVFVRGEPDPRHDYPRALEVSGRDVALFSVLELAVLCPGTVSACGCAFIDQSQPVENTSRQASTMMAIWAPENGEYAIALSPQVT